jgi:hypothetical protein
MFDIFLCCSIPRRPTNLNHISTLSPNADGMLSTIVSTPSYFVNLSVVNVVTSLNIDTTCLIAVFVHSVVGDLEDSKKYAILKFFRLTELEACRSYGFTRQEESLKSAPLMIE